MLRAIVGATATGKTRMAIEVARPGVEIVSCDAFGVYRELDISADKPSRAEREAVPHHLFDVASSAEEFTAVRYRTLARATIDDIQRRGGVPLLVGASGLYFRAAVDELSFAPSDPLVRDRLEALPVRELIERIRAVDPATVERLDLRNKRRVVRAAEIIELTGRPIERGEWHLRPDVKVVGLTRTREELYALVDERVDREIADGLVEEIHRATIGRTAAQGVGVKEVMEHLEGRIDLDGLRALLRRNTRKLVRKQESWFRGDPRVVWVNVTELGWDAARARVQELLQLE